MKRNLLESLEEWRSHPLRKPLILRGARQVGKTWLVRDFGKQFDNFIEINFEESPSAKQLFNGDLDIKALIKSIQFLSGEIITPGKTLLFLDEIQECERAILALRYFKENLPDLHVVAAGSLIDFAIDNIGLPVGRVQFLYLHPLSFNEYLNAMDLTSLVDATYQKDVHVAVHQKILQHLKDYLWLGGLPAVVKIWRDTQNGHYCQASQDEIVQTYLEDFNKYARRKQIEKVSKVFMNVPQQLGQKFKYSRVDPDERSAPLKSAVALLKKANILHQVYHCSAQGLPLMAGIDEKRFKLFSFDIGITQRLLGLKLSHWISQPLQASYLGGLMEQFVAQEYLAYTATTSAPELYYWHKENKQSNAEVDFIFQAQQAIIPVEVKTSTRGGMKSLNEFLKIHPHCPYGLKISEQPYNQHQQIVSIPLYSIEAWLKGTFDYD